MQKFLTNNKVLISALVSALVLVLQQYMAPGADFSWKAIGIASLLAVIGVVANQWKGQGVTIFGIIGTLAGVFHNIWTTGTFTWNEFILASLVAILTTLAPSLHPQKAAS